MHHGFFSKFFNRFSHWFSHRNFNNQSSRFSSSFNNRSSKAFTLIEILIYTAIFSVVAAGIIGVAWNVTRIHTSQIAENEVDENLRYVMNLINSKVRDASIIQQATGTTLILQMSDPNKSPVIFSLNNGTMFMQEGTADPIAITSDRVAITSLEFQKVSMPGAKDGVRVNLTIAYKEPAGTTGAQREYLTTITKVNAITFSEDILPGNPNLYNIGMDVARWKNGYFSGNVNVTGDVIAGGTVTGLSGLCMGSDCRSSWGQVTGVTGSGTQNYIAKWATSGSLTNSQIYDSGTNVGIGTTSPAALLDVQGAAQFGTGNVNLIDATGKIAGISSTYFADLSGANLTNLNASNLGSGTVPSARVSGSYTGITGVGTLTAGTWNATPIADAYIASASTWNAKMSNPMTTLGDIIYGGTSGAPTRLAGSAGFLKSTGAAAPTWTTLSASDIPGLDASKITSGTLPVARGGTGAGSFTSNYLIKGNGTNALSSSVIYDNGTNVGIGTTGPQQKLEVNGITRITRPGVSDTYLETTVGDVAAYINGYDPDGYMRMYFQSNGNTRMTIDGYTGNVGIGTTSPSAQLHTTAGVRFQGIANNFSNRRMVVSDASGNLAYRDLDNPISFLDAPFGQYVMYTPTTNNVLFAADKRFTVTQTGLSSFNAPVLFNGNYDDSGAVINTDDTAGVININLINKGEFDASYGLTYSYGWVYVHFYYYYYTDNVKVRLKTKNAGGEFVWRDYVQGTNISNNSSTRVIKIPLSGNYYCSDIEIVITSDTVNGSGTKNVWVSEIEFVVSRSATYYAQPIVSKMLDNSIYGIMSFKDSNNSTKVSIVPSTGNVYALGNVGIGTASPAKKLDVVGDIQASGSIYGTYAGNISATNVSAGTFASSTGGGNFTFPANLYINGNVGIGTTNPGAKLTVAQSDDSHGIDILGYDDMSSNYLKFYVSDLGHAYGRTASGKTFFFQSGGNLDFKSATGYGVYFNYGQSDDISFLGGTSNPVIIKGNGNVGIGTTNPSQKLHVVGDARFDSPIIEVFGSAETRTFKNLVSYEANGSVNGAQVIQTNIPQDDHTFIQTDISIWELNANKDSCVITMGGYWSTEANGSFQALGYTNLCPTKYQIRIGRNNSTGKTAIILGDTGSVWSYPRIQVLRMMASYGVSDSYADGWTIAPTTDLSGYVNLRTVPDKSVLGGLVQSTVNDSNYFTGNVGIGTTTPGYKLDVTGQINASSGLCIAGDCKTAWSQVAGMTNPMTTLGDIIYGGASGAPTRLAGSAGFLKSTGAAAPSWSALAASDIPALDASKITSGTFDAARIPNLDASKITSGTFDAARIPSLDASKITSGTFGVARGGTGATSFTSNYLIKGNGTNALSSSIIYDNGTNVGIGTTSPAKKLHVIGDIQASGFIYGSYGGNISATNVASGAFGASTGGGNYSFPAKVGIGTTSPATELDVSGTVKTQAFQLTTGAIANYVLTADASGNATWQPSLPGLPAATTGQTIYFNGTSWAVSSNLYNNDSNVGIGTTSPQAKLHVYTTSGSYVCTGVASACSNFSSQTSCTNQSGCSWTQTSGSCKGFADQTTCESYGGCLWLGSYCSGIYITYVCSGTPNQCSTFSTQATCQAQSGCSWTYVNDPVAVFTGGRVGIGTTNPATTTALDVNGVIQGKFAGTYTGSTSRTCSSSGNGTTPLNTGKYYPDWFCALGFVDARETDTLSDQSKCNVKLDTNNQWVLEAIVGGCGDQAVYCGINCIQL